MGFDSKLRSSIPSDYDFSVERVSTIFKYHRVYDIETN